jgi:very-short-patch-repair endonuclease
MESFLKTLKIELRELCVSYLVLRQIDDVFSNAGLKPSAIASHLQVSGQRRTLVEEYYASINWENFADIEKFLKVLELLLILPYLPDDSKNYLRELCRASGFEIDQNGHTIRLSSKSFSWKFKNLIFAANGPKPEIVISDSVSNDIQIVRNAEYCLVYDRPISQEGLLWLDLLSWWKELTKDKSTSEVEIANRLYKRLARSLQSYPERLLYRTYYGYFSQKLAEKLPALIPQVYLHYDPYTLKQRHLSGEKILLRQRMDFLLLLSEHERIVIEVDGKQHYAIGETANPQLYAEMLSEDRRLRLAGYEVYRFGGYELQEQKGEMVVKKFFQQLFKKHSILNS